MLHLANYYKAFLFVSFTTLLALNVDLLTGATMIKSSVLGYDPMAGARYYGVGNEYMGVMIGCSILAQCGRLSSMAAEMGTVADWLIPGLSGHPYLKPRVGVPILTVR